MQRALHALARPAAALGLLLATAGAAQAQTTFTFSGAAQPYFVPAGVTQVRVVATGAAGGAVDNGSPSRAYGAKVQAIVTVVPGEILTVVVGGQGSDIDGDNGHNGFNGGGLADAGGTGGGATDLRRNPILGSTGDYLSSRNALLVAGGGGGSTFNGSSSGGNGGTPVGADGQGVADYGRGATTTAPGGGGVPGTGGTGGYGFAISTYNGGGGGGYYGGGGGAESASNGGGGGGSSYVLPTGSSNVSYSLASTIDDGMLTITPVGPAPTLTSLSTPSALTGTSITLTGTHLTAATEVSFNGTAATTFAVVDVNTVTATVPANATSGPVTITTPDGTTAGLPFTVIYPDLVVSTLVDLPPGIYNTITITNGGVAYMSTPGLLQVMSSMVVQPGGYYSSSGTIVTGPGSFSLSRRAELSVSTAGGISASGPTGNIQVTGTRYFSPDATYNYTGPGPQITGSGLPARVNSLRNYNQAPVTFTSSVAIRNVLSYYNGTPITCPPGITITLLSDADSTASIQYTGTAYSGTYTVQRYISGDLNPGAGYRHISAPVDGPTVNDLNTPGFAPVVNPAYNTSPTPGLVTPFPTVYGYDETRLATTVSTMSAFDKGFFSPASLGTPLAAGQGYALQMPAAQTFSFTGTIRQGTVDVALTRGPSADAG